MGIEPVSIALAVFPLITRSMQIVRNTSLSAVSSYRFAAEITILENRLRVEQLKFETLLSNFLPDGRSTGTTEALSDMIDEQSLKSMLGDRGYIVFLELVVRLRDLLYECQRIWDKVSRAYYQPQFMC